MNDGLSLLSRTQGEEWQAVEVGPETVGWIGPNIPVQKQAALQAIVTVMTGDRSIVLNTTALGIALVRIEADLGEDIVGLMLCYNRRFAISLPVESLDSAPGSDVIFSPRTTETLYAALKKLFSAVADKVQSELHACDTPAEVVRKCAELDAYGYPYGQWINLTWRGVLLDGLLENTAMRVRVLNYGPTPWDDPYSYANGGKIRLLPHCTGWTSFISWQTRNGYDIHRILPQNVFLLRADTEEEYQRGQRLLRDPNTLKNYLSAATGHADMQDVTVLLCPAGDPLEEWVDGQVFSVEDFLAATSSRNRDGE